MRVKWFTTILQFFLLISTHSPLSELSFLKKKIQIKDTVYKNKQNIQENKQDTKEYSIFTSM